MRHGFTSRAGALFGVEPGEWDRYLSEYLVSEFVRQADYADRLFPDAVNTLRVVTLNDDADGPFVAGAVHRVGTAASAPVDNWSRGGLSVEIAGDGTLSDGARWSSAGELRWFDAHPDTGDPLAGVEMPGWPAVRERILWMAAALPSLPHIGWDVVLTDEGDGENDPGFVVIERNSHPGVETLQVHRPLLDDPRVRRFYERHGHA
ncbi:sugar-transfer associated ATP-grasp domain-containing protein [Candidatus Halobonum tyrrellensis]|uniref:Alpha-L-glutamate ligase-related protein ATP-grasp domain-containing protein n=1 Tax=Candidatus Halobonum tyrrellensis G22 TaxID=1324957 RepID=V4HJV9_9EURY|nr:sugar-transfer associated ATP-grasp domain-containing protein [Candidatus Halobonum tyrrellensis]ESP90053.1 hypothetical protein K933_00782 [Candidatus Halobonum tyrrellensis G22]